MEYQKQRQKELDRRDPEDYEQYQEEEDKNMDNPD